MRISVKYRGQLKSMALSLIAMSFSVSAAFAQSETPLFKDLLFNTQKSVLEQDSTFVDCSNVVGSSALCKKGVKFLDHEFVQVLIFADRRLRLVSLSTKYELSLHQRALGVLMNNFVMTAMQSGDKTLDILEVLNNETRDVGVSRVNAFEKGGLQKGKLSYIFNELPKEQVIKYKNNGELQRQMPISSREITLGLDLDERGSAYIRLYFALPKRVFDQLEKSSTMVEKF